MYLVQIFPLLPVNSLFGRISEAAVALQNCCAYLLLYVDKSKIIVFVISFLFDQHLGKEQR